MERLLELVNDKLSGNPLFSNYVQVPAAEYSRLDKMDSLIEELAVKVDALSTTSKACVTCANSGKSNHSENNSLKLKICFKCKEKGHISRYWKADSEIESLSHRTASQTFKKTIFESKYFGKRINVFTRHWE